MGGFRGDGSPGADGLDACPEFVRPVLDGHVDEKDTM